MTVQFMNIGLRLLGGEKTTKNPLLKFFFFRKETLINEERLQIIKELSKKPDIYERLARAIGKFPHLKHVIRKADFTHCVLSC